MGGLYFTGAGGSAGRPFVGLFIARISRGRTLREFVFGALVGPTLFTLFWMTVFGNSAIELIFSQGHAPLAEAVQMDTSIALFKFLDYFPLPDLLSLVAIVMVIVFFVTCCRFGCDGVEYVVLGRPRRYADAATCILDGDDWAVGDGTFFGRVVFRRCKLRQLPVRYRFRWPFWRPYGVLFVPFLLITPSVRHCC